MDRPFIALNDAERARLRTLVERLSDEDLRRSMPAGWTIAAVFAHMAFWDARILFLLDRWAGGASPSKDDWEPPNIDWVNDSAKVLCLALPVRTAANLALSTAETVDRRVAAMSDELIEQNEKAGGPVNLFRAEHRREHLDEIERALS